MKSVLFLLVFMISTIPFAAHADGSLSTKLVKVVLTKSQTSPAGCNLLTPLPLSTSGVLTTYAEGGQTDVIFSFLLNLDVNRLYNFSGTFSRSQNGEAMLLDGQSRVMLDKGLTQGTIKSIFPYGSICPIDISIN